MLTALVYVYVNLVVDIIYAYVDPRIEILMAVSEGRATRVVAKRSLSANAASRWRGIRRAFAKNPLMLLGFVIFVLIALSAVAAPLITFHDPVRTNIPERLEAPSLRHWFGTDHLGVDVYARTMYRRPGIAVRGRNRGGAGPRRRALLWPHFGLQQEARRPDS